MPPGNDWTKSHMAYSSAGHQGSRKRRARILVSPPSKATRARGSLRLAKPDRARAFCPLSPGLPRPGIIISHYGATPLQLPHSVRKHL